MQLGQFSESKSKLLCFHLKAKNVWWMSDWNRERVPNFRTLVENCKLLEICIAQTCSIITGCSGTIMSLSRLLWCQIFSKYLKLLLFIKNGIMTEPRNYQPIAVLSLFSKVLERLVHDQLYSFLEIKEILYRYQFGFWKKFPTKHVILKVADKLKEAIDKKKISCGVFLDWSKAFHTVNHEILP